MNRISVVAALCLLPLPAPAQAPVAGPASCEVERAVYEMTAPDTDEIWRIGLVPARHVASIASDLYLKLTTPQRDYWFTFSVSQGYSGISVFPVSDPYAEDGPHDLLGPPFGANPKGITDPDVLGALRFLTLDTEFNVAFVPPMSGEDAPPYIMLPEIGRALWYDAAALTEDETADRDPMPRGIFKRTQCLAAPHPQAGP
ncbi:hypothetical protein [Pelagibacterium sediminicola]|uniref:hypothetical protein n=1 Tax=Pelagibacterium sediminicola TaxID=2248761 RepID=UPI000E31C572|nr:hypothetical protein [Pelagibacterium sediminicola]